jgi:tRNA-binding EMAP/Myf-like protein
MEYLIKVSAIILLFFACYKLFLNRETFFESNRTFLLLGLIAAFTLPFVVIPKYILVEPNLAEHTMAFGNITSQSMVVGNSVENSVENSIGFMTMLTYIYFAGVLLFLGRFLFQFSSLLLLIINSTKKRMASYIYVITKNALSPFSFFNWIVFNPEHFNESELKQIIDHEKVHAKQLHSIDIVLVEMICIVLWFNPLIWMYKKVLRQNLEFIADKNAQAATNCKKSYQHLLLKTSVPNYHMALTNNFYNSLIKKRIVMLHKNRSHNRNQLKFLLILPALAIFLTSFNTKDIYVEKEPANTTVNTILNRNDFESSNEEINVENTQPIRSEKATTKAKLQKTNPAIKQDIASYLIESTFTDEQLNHLKTKLKSQGITLKINGVKRNSDHEITAIKISAKGNHANANYSISNDFPIKTIKITFNAKDNSISIGNVNGLIQDKDYMYTHKDGVFTIDKLSDKGSNVFVYSSDDDHDNNHKVIEADGKLIVKSKGKVFELKKDNKDKNTFVIADGDKVFELKSDSLTFGKTLNEWKDKDGKLFIESSGNNTLWSDDKDSNVIIQSSGKTLWKKDNDDIIAIQTIGKGNGQIFISGADDKALYIIDGKEVTKKDVDALNSDSIESATVLKGNAATKLYGKKAKNGAIVITTKKNKD